MNNPPFSDKVFWNRVYELLDEVYSKGENVIDDINFNTYDLAFLYEVLGYGDRALRKKFYTKIEEYLFQPIVKAPDQVDETLYRKIVKSRCGIDLKYLQEGEVDILKTLAKKMNIIHPLNLKSSLCLAVDDLNSLARIKTNNVLGRCREKLLTLDVNMDINKTAYFNLLKELTYLDKIVQKYNSGDTFALENPLCPGENGYCLNAVLSLHSTALAVREKASTCSKEVDNLIRNAALAGIRRRELAGENVGFFEKFSTRYL
jgi:hypothetical protein